jgi:hypothetical protein
MPDLTLRRHTTPLFCLLMALMLVSSSSLFAQGGGGGRGGGQRGGPGGPPAAQSAKTAAPVDLTGYWVSIVTEDWIERMSPDSPPSGTGGARGLAAARGPAPTPPPNGEQCRVYAAGGSLRVPTRLNITWADDNTLKIQMDAGNQTRLLHFNTTTPPPAEKSLQGYSVAAWELGAGARGGGRGGPPGGAAPAAPRWGSLNVTTTNLSGGYLLSSRSLYSDNAVLTEYFSKHSDFGVDYFTVTAQIQDGPQTRVTSSTFKKEPNGSKFTPGPCEIVR